MRIEDSESLRELHLTPTDKKPFNTAVLNARTALEDCKRATKQNCLTEAEYHKAHADFKLLVEIPWQKKEAIYIEPEFIEGQLNPKLSRYKFALERNLPYHTFITEGYATTWPILLRLYYGLSCGYQISVEQFHSMLKLSYWLATGLKIETIALFEAKSNCLTEKAETFFSPVFKLMSSFQRTDFRTRLLAAPINERTAQFIELNDEFINICNITKDHVAIKLLAALNQIPIWTPAETFMKMKASGLSLFGAMMLANLWPYHPVAFNNKMYLLLPSQTVLLTYARVINPTRTVKYVRRLGAISAGLMLAHSDKNERAGTLIAPGIGTETDISNYIVHLKVSLPALIVEHDDYHFLLDATLSKNIYDQINQLLPILRRELNDATKFTCEIERCIERERSHEWPEQERFYELLKYIFAVDPDADSDKYQLRKSSVLALIDMIIYPQKWQYYQLNKLNIINLLLPHKSSMIYTAAVESVINNYSRQVNDPGITAMLTLIRFHLNDEHLCDQILICFKQNAFSTKLIWEKLNEGLEPLILVKNNKYTFEQLAAMSDQDRLALLAPVHKTVYNIPKTVTVDHNYKLTITNNQGELLASGSNIIQFAMPCTALAKEVRTKLGLDRLRIVKPMVGQLDYLKKLVPEIVIENDVSQVDAFLCTFPNYKRKLVESILNPQKWQATQKSTVVVQSFFRGHRERNHFFRDAQQRKSHINSLKSQIIVANQKEDFATVSSLANCAKIELDISKKEEQVIRLWSNKRLI